MTVIQTVLRLLRSGVREIYIHKISSATIALLLIALAFVGTDRFVVPDTAHVRGHSTNDQPAATVNYFKGQQDFDSELIWSSLSPELISEAEAAGATVQDLQDQLDQARELGRTLEQVAYIGSYDLHDGGSMHFYVATVKSTVLSSDVEEIFYVFTLDQQGKITSIE
jgi:hypothetical protein